MAKLTIILGKNLGPDAYAAAIVNPETAVIIQFPEVAERFNPPRAYPLHPDNFVPQTLGSIRRLLGSGIDAKLWTMSEYLVSWIAQEVGKGGIKSEDVEVRLYADDNASFRRFGIGGDGMLTDIGDGHWPFGWFMPNDFSY